MQSAAQQQIQTLRSISKNSISISDHRALISSQSASSATSIPKQDEQIIPDSRNITFKIAEYYPQLMPEGHAATIRRLLAELHAIDYYSLTFTGKYMFPCGTIATLLERWNSPETSDRYREALDRKIDQ
jgi:hypothetical protein